MKSAGALPFPPGRILSNWVKQLAPPQPQAYWVGHLFFHHVDVPVVLRKQGRVDPLVEMLLRVLPLDSLATLEEIEKDLPLTRPALRRLIERCEADGLATASGTDKWQLTPAGGRCLENGEHSRRWHARRGFYFLECGSDRPTPRYLPYAGHHLQELPQPPSWWGFSRGTIADYINQPAEWKERHQFPADVAEVVPVANGRVAPGEVLLDRPLRLAALMTLVSDSAGRQSVQVYAVEEQGWTLYAEAPALTFTQDWESWLPAVRTKTPTELWHESWREWAQVRGITAAEADACELRQEGSRLRVRAEPGAIERLRGGKALGRGDIWLLAGVGPIRAAAAVDLSEKSAPA